MLSAIVLATIATHALAQSSSINPITTQGLSLTSAQQLGANQFAYPNYNGQLGLNGQLSGNQNYPFNILNGQQQPGSSIYGNQLGYPNTQNQWPFGSQLGNPLNQQGQYPTQQQQYPFGNQNLPFRSQNQSPFGTQQQYPFGAQQQYPGGQNQSPFGTQQQYPFGAQQQYPFGTQQQYPGGQNQFPFTGNQNQYPQLGFGMNGWQGQQQQGTIGSGLNGFPSSQNFECLLPNSAFNPNCQNGNGMIGAQSGICTRQAQCSGGQVCCGQSQNTQSPLSSAIFPQVIGRCQITCPIGQTPLMLNSADECFSCVSANDWTYFANRINGLKYLALNERPPLAPMSCVLDPMKSYADRAAVACPGKCFKFTSATIKSDGGIELFLLRGCYERLVNSSNHPPPNDDRCYQSPDHYTHEIGTEYHSQCFCKGFMCNSSKNIDFFKFTTILLFFIYIL
ncbi:unnamed protein product, partial [Mesorhabditis belari]|uniref:Uncharacterized protein n=1 Tax=Mesorhabditis belari TaxID=2138241 RepID=A0AAF3FSR8_9BILA